MNERRHGQRTRALRSAKILLNSKGSVIDCTVRNLSAEGACLQVTCVAGIPRSFELLMHGDNFSRTCDVVWQAQDRIGVAFRHPESTFPESAAQHDRQLPAASADHVRGAQPVAGADFVRGELLVLRSALDEVPFGVALLDYELRAQFLNRAFRKMWRLSDTKANSKPAFVALMYHGRDTRAYDVPPTELDAYVAERVAHVKAGNPRPIDLRLANGEVIRFQCTVLPAGGRMLSYTYVTDIVRHCDELESLRSALDSIAQGVILLDSQFNTQFINRAARELIKLSDAQAGQKPSYTELVNASRTTRAFDMSPDELDGFISRRLARIRAGDSSPDDLRMSDGRILRSQCSVLPSGGRMLTYTDVTDLARRDVRDAEHPTHPIGEAGKEQTSREIETVP